jgi:hypothetical protein
MSMYHVTVTLRNGRKLTGCVNAYSERHCVSLIRNTNDGAQARVVVAVRLH